MNHLTAHVQSHYIISYSKLNSKTSRKKRRVRSSQFTRLTNRVMRSMLPSSVQVPRRESSGSVRRCSAGTFAPEPVWRHSAASPAHRCAQERPHDAPSRRRRAGHASGWRGKRHGCEQGHPHFPSPKHCGPPASSHPSGASAPSASASCCSDAALSSAASHMAARAAVRRGSGAHRRKCAAA